MLPDWKEPEKLADNVIVDSESKDETLDETAITNSLQHSSEVPGLQPGSIFAGHYEILGLLGQGGMSTVYKAKHLLVDSVRAIKVIRLDQVENSKVLRRFQQEGKAALALEHTNIGRVYEFGIEATFQKPFLVMDYVEGKTLSATLSEEGALTTERACRLISQVCEGLQEAHSKGVVHRDIKPGNIILTKDSAGSETAKIVDFGIAKMIGPDDAQNLTQTGEVFGTPLYMSPEQCLGQKVDARSDLYSLGCVLYECLSGKPPFEGSSSLETIMMHVNGALPAFDNKVISAQLKSVVLKSLSKNPEERFQSASDLTEALTQDGSSIRAHFDSTMRLLKRARRDDTSMGALVLIMLIFLSLVSIIIFLSVKTFRFEDQSMKVQLIEEKRNDPVAWAGMAHELEQKGDFVNAERAYRKAIQLKPDYKPAWLGLGKILEKQGKSTDADAAFRRADELKSDLEK
jgi:serine/threonine protein kinase